MIVIQFEDICQWRCLRSGRVWVVVAEIFTLQKWIHKFGLSLSLNDIGLCMTHAIPKRTHPKDDVNSIQRTKKSNKKSCENDICFDRPKHKHKSIKAKQKKATNFAKQNAEKLVHNIHLVLLLITAYSLDGRRRIRFVIVYLNDTTATSSATQEA